MWQDEQTTKVGESDERDAAFPGAGSGTAGAGPVPALRLDPGDGGLGLLERMTAALRRYLDDRGLGDFLIIGGGALDLADVDEHLAALDDGATWDALPLLSAGEQPAAVARDGEAV